MDDNLLAERLQHLADAAPVPATPPADDVRRGRRRLRRRRAAEVVGTAAAVAAVSSVALVGGPAPAGDDAPAPDPTTHGPAAEAPAQAPESRRLDVEKALEMVRGRHVGRFTLAEIRAMAAVVQDRVDGPVHRFGVGRARSWQAAGAADCPPGWTCEDVVVEGAARARWASQGDVRQLVAELRSGVVVLTVNRVDERPSDLAYGTD